VGYFGTFIFRDGQWQQRSDSGPELVALILPGQMPSKR